MPEKEEGVKAPNQGGSATPAQQTENDQNDNSQNDPSNKDSQKTEDKKTSENKEELGSRANKAVREAKAKAKEFEEKYESLKSRQANNEDLTDEDKKLLDQLKNFGFVSAKDIASLVESLETKNTANGSFEKVMKECETNLPDFNRAEVLEYGEENGIYNPVAAYKAMMFDREKAKESMPKAPDAEVGSRDATTSNSHDEGKKPLSFKDGSLRDSLEKRAEAMIR